MYTMQNIQITHISYKEKGVLIFAKLPRWIHGVSFFVDFTGRVKGKSSSGTWFDLQQESALLIQEKLKSFLKEHPDKFS